MDSNYNRYQIRYLKLEKIISFVKMPIEKKFFLFKGKIQFEKFTSKDVLKEYSIFE